MLTIQGRKTSRFCDGVSRRNFLTIGGLGLGGLSLPALLRAEAAAGRSQSHKAVIMVYLPGGPPHLDLFDLKPDAPSEIRGPFQSIKTNVPGIRICELLPEMAGVADKLVFVRSLVGAKNRHESFQCHTGRPGGRADDNEPAGGWPCIGSVVSKLLGPGPGRVPASVDVGPKMGYGPYNNTGLHDANGVRSWPGFLGIGHTPFRPEGAAEQNMVLNGITTDRLGNRRRLLASFDHFRKRVDNSGVLDGVDAFQEQAFGILTSGRLAAAFDLDREDPRVRARYGKGGSTTSSFGGAPKSMEHLLLARRLVEAGARCVSVAFGAWDWHGNRGGSVEKLGHEDFPMFDHAIATLVSDLDVRGMLDDVSVVVWGEFGRTPKINAKGGRDHWPKVGCALLAGGGMRAGQAIGRTTRHGDEADDRPVHFQDVFATLYHNLGLDPNRTTVTDLAGRPHYLVDSQYAPIAELL